MPDYAPNFTGRYRLTYQTQSQVHTMQFRYSQAEETLPVALVASIEDFLDALAPFRFSDWTILGAENSPASEDFFVPSLTVPTILAGAVATGNPGQKPVYLGFQGRTCGEQGRGIRVRGEFQPRSWGR